MTDTKAKHSAVVALITTMVIGGGGLLAIGIFIFRGPPGWIDFDWRTPAALAWDAGLSLFFFLQHSAMIRSGTRRYMERMIPRDFSGSVYSTASGGVLLALVLLWQPSDPVLVSLSGVWRWLARACFLAALAGFAWTSASLQDFDPLGAGPMLKRLGRSRPGPMPMSVQGPYRWVRHPFYFFSIVMIWSCPTLTADRLMFNILWTFWIWVGAVLEERDLVMAYGQAYRNYQQNVPRLLPLKWR